MESYGDYSPTRHGVKFIGKTVLSRIRQTQRKVNRQRRLFLSRWIIVRQCVKKWGALNKVSEKINKIYRLQSEKKAKRSLSWQSENCLFCERRGDEFSQRKQNLSRAQVHHGKLCEKRTETITQNAYTVHGSNDIRSTLRADDLSTECSFDGPSLSLWSIHAVLRIGLRIIGTASKQGDGEASLQLHRINR